MTRSAFSRLHPAVSVSLCGVILCLAFLTRDPVMAVILGAGALLFAGECRGFAFAAKRLLLFLLITLAGAVTNPFISHRGVTILFYLGTSAVTAESALYGAVSGAMLADVILWCETFYHAVPLESTLYYLGKALPRTALVLSMALRFVPRLALRLREARAAQRAFHPEDNVKNALGALRTGVALTLEECCEIAAGMEERGYGTGKRTSYALYRFGVRDGCAALIVLLLGAGCAAGALTGAFRFECYPVVSFPDAGRVWYVFPFLISFAPAFTERKEKVLWRS